MNGKFIQLMCSFIVTLTAYLGAFAIVWPSYALRLLESDESLLSGKINEIEASLISSLPMLGSLVASPIAGYVTEAIGRKKTQILCGLCYTTSWTLIVTARGSLQLLIGRSISGLAIGMNVVAIITYMSEVTQLSIRGTATALIPLLYNCGVASSYLHGWFLSYKVICYSSLAASLLYVVLVFLLPETPVYLMKIGREKEALNSLKFYRGASEPTDEILEELALIKTRIQRNDANETENLMVNENKAQETDIKNNAGPRPSVKNPWILLFTDVWSRRALMTVSLFMVLPGMMGSMAVQTNAGHLFKKAAPSLSPDMCSVILAVVLILTCVISVGTTDLFPRRTLMIAALAVSTVCLAGLGSTLRWPSIPTWVGLASIFIFCIAFNFGVSSVGFAAQSESFSHKVNSAASGLIVSIMCVTNFFLLFLYIPCVNYLGTDGTFFMYTGVGVLATAAAACFMKETRFVPMEQVEQMYRQGYFYRKCDVGNQNNDNKT